MIVYVIKVKKKIIFVLIYKNYIGFIFNIFEGFFILVFCNIYSYVN